MRVTWRSELPHWLLLAALFLLAALAWPSAPERIPVHWGASGEVDRYGGKVEGLLGLPIAALAVYLLLLFLPSIDPRRRSYDLFAGAYAALRFAVLAALAAVYGLALLSIQGYPVAVERLVPATVGIFLVVTGNLMGKIRPNWFVGVRTPWTLTSNTAWGKTNRLGGWLLIGTGLAMIAAGLMGWPWLMAGIPGLAAGLAVLLMVYSYLVWRRDPRKESEAGTPAR